MEYCKKKDKEGLLAFLEVVVGKANEQKEKLQAEGQKWKHDANNWKAEAEVLKADGQKWKADAKKWETEARKSIAAVTEDLKAECRKWKADAEDWKAEAERLKVEGRTSKAYAEDRVEFWMAKANEPIDVQGEKWKAEAEKRKADAIEVKAGMSKVVFELTARAEKAETEAQKWKSLAEEWKSRIAPVRKSPYDVGRENMSKAEVEEAVAAGRIWRATRHVPAVDEDHGAGPSAGDFFSFLEPPHLLPTVLKVALNNDGFQLQLICCPSEAVPVGVLALRLWRVMWVKSSTSPLHSTPFPTANKKNKHCLFLFDHFR